MPKCKVVIVAERAITDEVTRNVTLVDILDVLGAYSFPAPMHRLACLFLFEREKGDPDTIPCRVDISISGDTLLSGPTMIDFQGHQSMNRQILNIDGLVIPRPGTLKFSVFVEATEIGEWTVPVVKPGDGPQMRFDLQEPASIESGDSPRQRNTRKRASAGSKKKSRR